MLNYFEDYTSIQDNVHQAHASISSHHQSVAAKVVPFLPSTSTVAQQLATVYEFVVERKVAYANSHLVKSRNKLDESSSRQQTEKSHTQASYKGWCEYKDIIVEHKDIEWTQQFIIISRPIKNWIILSTSYDKTVHLLICLS